MSSFRDVILPDLFGNKELKGNGDCRKTEQSHEPKLERHVARLIDVGQQSVASTADLIK